MNDIKSNKKGFTIIEVLIVLAIAGLIMLVVFLAVPALQRNQRNTARNSEASRISAAVTECLANRNGVTTACDSIAPPNPEVNVGTLNELATVTFGAAANGSLTSVGVRYGNVCDASGALPTTTGATARSFAVLYVIEPNVTRCIAS